MKNALEQLKKDMTLLNEDIGSKSSYSYLQEDEDDDVYNIQEKTDELTNLMVQFSIELREKFNDIMENNTDRLSILSCFMESMHRLGFDVDRYEAKAILGLLAQVSESVLAQQTNSSNK